MDSPGQILFDIPVDDLTSLIVFAKDIKKAIGYIDDPDVEQAGTVFVLLMLVVQLGPLSLQTCFMEMLLLLINVVLRQALVK